MNPARPEVSASFTAEENAYREMLEGECHFVGDRWFGPESTECERARYLSAYKTRLERNERRRERRRQLSGEAKSRRVRASIPLDPESLKRHRDALELRKCQRRATVARCPTPSEIRTAWKFRLVSRGNAIRLGGMLMDLECYVDNSLRMVMLGKCPTIVARNPGIRGWIAENCPELLPKYKTMMRLRAIAKRFRQLSGVMDPVPVAVLMDPTADIAALKDCRLQVQPRGDDEADGGGDGNDGDGGGDSGKVVRNRYAWEESEPKLDGRGRAYLANENYHLVQSTTAVFAAFSSDIAAKRDFFLSAIILNGKENLANENYCKLPSVMPGEGVAAGRKWVREHTVEEIERMRKGVLMRLLDDYVKFYEDSVLMPRRPFAGFEDPKNWIL